jgi:hypothetical protein
MSELQGGKQRLLHLTEFQSKLEIKHNSVALVRERTIPTEWPPLVGEVNANFCGIEDVAWTARRIPYGRNLLQCSTMENYK